MIEWMLTGTALIVMVFLVRALLGNRMGAHLRYGLWLLVLIRLLVPLTFGESSASPANLARVSRGDLTAITVLPTATGTPEETGVFVQPDGAIADSHSMGYPMANADGTVTRYAVKLRLPDLLPVIWYTGMAVATVWFLFCNLRFYGALRRTRRLLRTDGRTRIYLADVPSPCLFGLLRPAVYVTEDAAADEETLEHVLLHETTHLRHGDHIWAFLRTVCLILWWYHPLVWLAARASRRDSELSCDASVLKQLGDSRRTSYGQTLLQLAARRRGIVCFSAASTLSGGGRQLRARIVAIARRTKPRVWAVVLTALLAAVAVGCAFSGAKEPREEPAHVEEPADTADTSDTATESLKPFTDADLVTSEGVALGMTWEQAAALTGDLETPLTEAMDLRSYYSGGVLYSFTMWEDQLVLTGMSTDQAAPFLPRGLGIGSSLTEALEALGCDPADDPGWEETWQLYGQPEGIPSAQLNLLPSGGRYLYAFTASGGLGLQFDEDGVLTVISCYITLEPETVDSAMALPVTDEALTTVHGIRLGMTCDEALSLMGAPDESAEFYNSSYAQKDGIYYGFSQKDDALVLTNYSAVDETASMPLGLQLGMNYEDVLVGFGLEAPPLPVEEPQVLYGVYEAPLSAVVTEPYGDCAGDLTFYTETSAYRCRLDWDGTISFIDCMQGDALPIKILFSYDPRFENAQVLDEVAADDGAMGLSGAILYTVPGDGQSFHVAFGISGYWQYLYPVGIGQSQDGGILEYEDGTFRYDGNGTVSLDVRDSSNGARLHYTVTYEIDDEGSVTFTAVSEPIA